MSTIKNNNVPKNVRDKRLDKWKSYKEETHDLSPLLKEYAEYLYFSENIKNVSIKTAFKYIRIVLDMVKFIGDIHGYDYKTFNNQNMNLITVKELDSFLKHYNAGIKSINNKEIEFMNQSSTINVHQSAIRKFFKWAFNKEYISVNISEKLEGQKSINDKRVITLDDDEIKSIYELIETAQTTFAGRSISLSKKQLEWHYKNYKRDKAIFQIMAYHGLRIEEVHNLNLSSFDFYKNEFTLFRKRDKISTAYMQDETAKIIMDYIENERPNSKDDALFLSNHGEESKRYSIEQIRKTLKKYVKLINPNKKFSPHKIRATFATKVIEMTNDIYTAQKLLDHESSKTTERYAQESEQRKKEVSHIITFNKK